MTGMYTAQHCDSITSLGCEAEIEECVINIAQVVRKLPSQYCMPCELHLMA